MTTPRLLVPTPASVVGVTARGAGPITPPAQTKRPRKSLAQRYGGPPIHLTATAQVSANAQASVNSQALHVPTADPILVTHFKFGYLLPAVYAGEGTAEQGLGMDGGGLQVQIGLNADVITNGYVPVWCLDKTTNLTNEQLLGSELASGNVNLYGEFIWELPRPLYLRPADQLNVSFYNLGQQAGVTPTARFSLQGVVLTGVKDPKTRILPYTASYVSKQFITDGPDSDSSTEQDLVNNTDQTLRLTRLVGRIDEFTSSGAYHTEGQKGDLFGFSSLGLTILTGKGKTLVPYELIYRDVFIASDRALALYDMKLDPGDYLIANLTQSVEEEEINALYSQVQIGMTGWREVAVS